VSQDRSVSPFMRLLVRAARSIRAAGLKPDPRARQTERPTGRKPEQDWETLGRDLGRAVRRFRDRGRSGG
jgi:hypothetical protein